MIQYPGRNQIRIGTVLVLAVWLCASVAVTQDDAAVVQPSEDEEVASEEASPAEETALRGQVMGPLEARSVALLLSGQTGGRVGGAVLWSVLPRDDGNSSLRVPIFVDIDGPSLLAEDPLQRLGISVHAYVLGEDGGVVAHLSEGYALDGAEWGEKIRGRGLKYGVTFDLEPGRYGLRVLVRNHRTGRVFLSANELAIPNPDESWPEMLPPVFAEPQTSWVEAAASGMANGPRFSVGSHEVLPAALPVVVVGESAEMMVVLRGNGQANELVARIRDRRGQVVAEPRLELGSTEHTWHQLHYTLAVLEPLNLPPGRYELEFEHGEGAAGSSVTRALPLVLVRTFDRPEGAAMAEKGAGLVDDGSGIPGAGVGVETEAVTDENEMRQRYLAALGLLADGDDQVALQSIADLERAAWAGGSNSGLLALRRIEDRVADEVIEHEVTALAPMVLLHRDMHRFYTVHGDGVLADASWRRAADLARKMAEASDDGSEARDVAGDLLLRVATDLLRSSSIGAGKDLLEQTLEIEPASRDALLSLAALYERLGEYEQAVEALRQAVREHAECFECQLRLAVNLTRHDEITEAEAMLRQLSELERPRWIVILACQELGRVLAGSGRLTEAETMLQLATERYTDDTLLVQNAWVLARQGRRWEANELLSGLRSGSGDDANAPRVRYTRWPGLDLESRWRRIVGFADDRRPDLGAVVAADPVPQEAHS